jgi:hypothetical protein
VPRLPYRAQMYEIYKRPSAQCWDRSSRSYPPLSSTKRFQGAIRAYITTGYNQVEIVIRSCCNPVIPCLLIIYNLDTSYTCILKLFIMAIISRNRYYKRFPIFRHIMSGRPPGKPDLSGYSCGAISSLVLTADRSALPRRDKEPDGAPC